MPSINERILKEISDLNRIVKGNGRPEEGMLFKLTLMQKALTKLIKDFESHCNSTEVKNKKYLGFLTPKHIDLLWKNFSRLMNIGIIATILWVVSTLDPETKQIIIKALFR